MSKNTLFAVYSLGNAVCVDHKVRQQAEQLIVALIEQKRHNYDLSDEKTQKKLLNSRRFYLYSLDYEEVVVFGTQETNLKSLFIDLALENKYFTWGPKGKMVGDKCIVDALAFQSQAYFFGKGEKMPLFAVKCDGEKREFLAADKAAEQKAGVTITPSFVLARRRNGETKPLSAVYPTQAPVKEEKKAETPIVLPEPVTPAPVNTAAYLNAFKEEVATVIPTVQTETTEVDSLKAELAAMKALLEAGNVKKASKELKLQKAAPIAPPPVSNGVSTATVQ